MNETWGLLVSFAGLDYGENTEHAFVHGVEFGTLWARMQSGREAEIEMTVHDINRVVIERAAVAGGWTVEFECSLADGVAVEGFLDMKMSKASAAKPNPHGLRVVRTNAGEPSPH